MEVYLRDFVPTFPCPPLFRIELSELDYFFEKPYSSKFKKIEKEVYVQYSLFGDSILSKVWFNMETLSELTNYHLYCLEIFLNDTDNEFNLREYFENSEIYIQDLEFPFRMYLLHLNSGTALGVNWCTCKKLCSQSTAFSFVFIAFFLT